MVPITITFYDERFSRAEDSANVLPTKEIQTNRQGNPCCLSGSMWRVARSADRQFIPDGGGTRPGPAWARAVRTAIQQAEPEPELAENTTPLAPGLSLGVC